MVDDVLHYFIARNGILTREQELDYDESIRSETIPFVHLMKRPKPMEYLMGNLYSICFITKRSGDESRNFAFAPYWFVLGSSLIVRK